MDTKLTNEDVTKRNAVGDNCYEENETEIWVGSQVGRGQGRPSGGRRHLSRSLHDG